MQERAPDITCVFLVSESSDQHAIAIFMILLILFNTFFFIFVSCECPAIFFGTNHSRNASNNCLSLKQPCLLEIILNRTIGCNNASIILFEGIYSNAPYFLGNGKEFVFYGENEHTILQCDSTFGCFRGNSSIHFEKLVVTCNVSNCPFASGISDFLAFYSSSLSNLQIDASRLLMNQVCTHFTFNSFIFLLFNLKSYELFLIHLGNKQKFKHSK